MTTANRANDEQAILWSGQAGQAWVDAQGMLDATFRPLLDRLLMDMDLPSQGRVLDVGCGTGATTLAIAQRLEESGEALGVDLSAPMIAAARARAARTGSPARFLCGDAQRHAFEAERYDLVISRFGVMFFDDAIAAFGNLRRAAKSGALLRFIVWRSPEENPFMTAAERAAAPLVPELPARRPDAPGAFSFADRQVVQAVLQASGWGAIQIRPVDFDCAFPASQLETYFTRLGPLGRVLAMVEPARRSPIVNTVRQAFEPYVQGDTVRFEAACWWVEARAVSGSP
jgi:SAM-dependent methyltransferase